jgi:uncharacterized membrane protein
MANESRDDDSGKFTEKYEDSEFVDAIRALGGSAGTAEVADELGCPHTTAYHRLDQLRDDGQLTSRQIGNAVLWVIEG